MLRDTYLNSVYLPFDVGHKFNFEGNIISNKLDLQHQQPTNWEAAGFSKMKPPQCLLYSLIDSSKTQRGMALISLCVVILISFTNSALKIDGLK